MNGESELDPRRARELIGVVQRLGVESAAAVVERFTAMVERASHIRGPEGASPRGDGASRTFERLLGDTARLAEAYLTFLEGIAAFVTASTSGARADSGEGVERISFPPAVPGSTVAARLWIHNTTRDPADVELRASALTAHGGNAIVSEAVTFEPGNPYRVAAGDSVEVKLGLDVPAGCQPGTYYGLVVASGLLGESIAMRIEISEEGRAP